ncbi:MAG: hypothetical protein GQ570_15385 [Helicobacteraceae bacterium]|nr:hypothetical protein [Helicobacteraceae bacterium]
MKKLLQIALLTTSLQAEGFYKTLSLGVGTAELQTNSSTTYNLTYEVGTIFENGVKTSLAFIGEYANIDESNINSYGFDAHLGYSFFERVDLYAIGSLLQQSSFGVIGYGTGYGAGTTLKLTKNLATALEYKTYTITKPTYEYDYATTILKLKWLF